MKKSFSVWSVCVFLAATAACTKSSSPSRPSDVAPEATTSVTDAASGITLTTPAPITPAPGTQIPFAQQPITLTVRNAVTTGAGASTYTFQVATDGAFAAIVATKAAVAEGANGQTSVTLEKLAGDKNYYWRVRANNGGANGLFSTPRALTVGPEVVLQKPVLGDPAPGASVSENPTLNVYTVQRTGPAGPIKYRFEVSENSSFASLVYVSTVDERTNLPYTPHIVTTKLTVDKTYFWRVQAQDPTNSVNSPYSDPLSFKVAQAIDLSKVNFVCGSPNVSKWAATSQVLNVGFGGGQFFFDHSRNGSWPAYVFPDGAKQEATVWALFFINGQWYAGGGERIRPGQTAKELGRPSDIGYGWYFMPNCGPMQGYVPQVGELVGFMATDGNARITDEHITEERTNVVLIAWPGDAGGFFPPFAYQEPGPLGILSGTFKSLSFSAPRKK